MTPRFDEPVDGLDAVIAPIHALMSIRTTIEDVLGDYPDLERDGILAALGVRRARHKRARSSPSTRREVPARRPARRTARSTATRGGGHDVLHTTELPEGNRTTEATIAELVDADDRVVVSKDRDFRNSHLRSVTPRRLLVAATGNIADAELLSLFTEHLDTVVAALDDHDYVELIRHALIVHPRQIA